LADGNFSEYFDAADILGDSLIGCICSDLQGKLK